MEVIEFINKFQFSLTFVGLIILYFIMKNFLRSYINQKAMNFATKQDISEITKIVEEVKYSFTKEAENLKAKLQFFTNIQLGIIAEERIAIIDYNKKYFCWLNSLIDSSMKNTNTYDNNEIDKYTAQLGNYFQDYLVSQAIFDLFVENEELVKIEYDLHLKTIDLLDGHPYLCAIKLKENNNSINRFRGKLLLTEWENEKYEADCKERIEILDKFRKNIIENFKIISPLAHKFQKISRDYIYKLLSEKTS